MSGSKTGKIRSVGNILKYTAWPKQNILRTPMLHSASHNAIPSTMIISKMSYLFILSGTIKGSVGLEIMMKGTQLIHMIRYIEKHSKID